MRRLLSILALYSSAVAQVTLSGNIKITPGSGSNPGISITNGAVCAISTSSLPPGLVGTAYGTGGAGVQLTSTNCSAPIVWSLAVGSGALPAGLTLSSGGLISGTPSVAGSSSVVITLLDNASHAPAFPIGLTVTATAGITPAFPDVALTGWCTTLACTPSANTIITVGDGTTGICAPSGCTYTTSQLAAAIAAVGCGQVLELTNVVYTAPNGNLTFNKVCDSTHWITIERDMTDTTFPPEGTRVTPCYSGLPSSALKGYPAYTCPSPARHMPFIQKSATGSVINIFGSYYRFVGIEWGRVNTYDLDFGILNMAISTCTAPDLTCMNAQPTNNIFDRNIIHGDAQRQTTRAIALGGTRWVAVFDSYIYDISLTYLGGGGDAQPFGWGNGKNFTNSGFGKFHNNFHSASTMGNLFCGGAFTEPVSPSTGFDGIPHDIWFKQNWYYKSILWDTQLGQTQGTSQTREGVTYPAAADQEFIQLPATIQLAVGQTYQVQTWTANDSDSGTNRSKAGTNSLTACGTNCGSVATVFSTVGSGIHQSISQFITTFTAPPSPGSVTYTRCWTTSDSRTATIGANRNMCASTVFTIVAANPIHQMVVGPAASDLRIQPSYSDAFGNSRQFALQFNAIPNFTSASTTWDVDGVVGGNSTVGTIDSTGLYTSPATTGAHTIHATAADSTVGSSTITVSATAPIVGFDGRPNTEKNGWELKCGRKILHENFLIENAWGSNGNGSGQGGQAILAHPFNQSGCPSNCLTSILSGATNIGYGPFEIADLTIRNGKAIHMGAGFVIGGSGNTLGIRRVAVSHILCDDCSYKHNSHGWNGVTYYSTQFNGGAGTVYTWESSTNPMSRDITYSHITDVGDVPLNAGLKGGAFGIAQNSLQPLSLNYVMQDSIFAATGGETFYDPQGAPVGQTSCNTNGGLGSNNTELKVLPCFAAVGGLTLSHLALLDSTTTITPGVDWPDAATLWQPLSTDTGLFVNYSTGDYHMVPGGPYAAGGVRQASDGTDLGANIDTINAIESTIRAGVRTP